jgi:hypothetical protein
MALDILDARADAWHWPMRWLYLFMRWSLAGIGAYLLVGHFVLTWGWFAGLWFFIAPALTGLAQGLRALPPES